MRRENDGPVIPGAIAKRKEALGLLRSALGIIDEVGGPPDIGAHVDLAICRLEQVLTGT